MSNKITYQFSAMPAEWLKSVCLNPTDKYILAMLILLSNNENVYKLGVEELSNIARVSRRQCTYIVNKLKANYFIEVNNRTRPVEIRVCLERVGGRSQDVSLCATDCAQTQTLCATDCADNKKFVRNLKQDCAQFGANLCATDCADNRYFKNSNNTRAGAREETETADVAAVRSMPDAGQAGENTRQGNEARFGLDDLNAATDCLAYIDKYGHFQYLFSNNRLFFRPYRVFSEKITEEEKNNVIIFFKEKCGKLIEFLPANNHLGGEQIIV